MVHFGLRLQKEQHEQWRVQYINYELLKQALDDIKKASSGANPGDCKEQKTQFQHTLALEIQKVCSSKHCEAIFFCNQYA
jgi:SPX domain protein involved in polyphosphate accumulation